MGEIKTINPCFSVIIPTYNRGDELNRCLKSLLDQTFKDFEVLVCDDGSLDNTYDVVCSFKDKLNINYIKEANFGGPARPRNNGIKNAKGKYLAFLDSDDWWFNDKLEYCYNYVDKHEFIFHDVMYYKGIILYKKSLFERINNFFKNKNPKKIIENGNFIACSSVCFNKQIISDIFFSEDKNIIALEDYYAWVKLFTNRKDISIKHIRIPLSAYSLNEDNISKVNTNYIYKLASFKNKLKKELNFETNKLCINYLIGSNYVLIGNHKRALIFLCYSLRKSISLEIKIKSLIKIFKIKTSI